jgi:hypothetical protein
MLQRLFVACRVYLLLKDVKAPRTGDTQWDEQTMLDNRQGVVLRQEIGWEFNKP